MLGEVMAAAHDGNRYCLKCGPECETWGAIGELPTGGLWGRAVKTAGTPIVVETSKWWEFTERLTRMFPKMGNVGVILSRAPEVCVASSRLQGDEDPVGRWARGMTSALWLEKNMDRVVRVRYEDLVEDPQVELQKVLDLVGLQYLPEMRRFWTFDHHPLRGSPSMGKQLRGEGRIGIFKKPTWPRSLSVEDAAALYEDPEIAGLAEEFGYTAPS
jgi:hypothetical protein